MAPLSVSEPAPLLVRPPEPPRIAEMVAVPVELETLTEEVVRTPAAPVTEAASVMESAPIVSE